MFLRPQPGGKIDDDLNWAMTNSLGDFASTFHIFDDGAASSFAPFAWIPTSFVLLALIALVVWLPFRHSITGRTIYAIGSAKAGLYVWPRYQSRQDRRLHARRLLRRCFALCGLTAGIAGVLLAGYSQKAYQGMGDAYLLPSIAAVVIGGTNILGGRGRYLGTLVGVILIVLLNSVLSIMEMPEAGRQVIYGGVIILMLLVYGRGERVAS